MPDDQRQSLRVGVMISVTLALLVVGIFLIGREQRFWERKLQYEIRFTRTNGLREGSPVSLTGVDIGSIQEISFPDDPTANYISVRVSLSGKTGGRIREDTVARIRTIGLLGDKYIELSAGSPNAPFLPPGSTIPSQDPIDYEALLGEGGDIVTNIVEASNSLKNVFAAIDRGEGLLGQMLKNREQGATALSQFQEAMSHLESTSAMIERVVKDVQSGKGALGVLLKQRREAEQILSRLDRASRALAEVGSRLERARGALPRLVEDEEYGRQLLGDLRLATRNLAELVEKANRGQGTLGQLVNDPSLYRDARELVSSTKSSWTFSLYRGIRGLFPPYAASTAESAPSRETTPSPTPTALTPPAN